MIIEISVLIAICVGLTEIVKKLKIPTRFIPLVALVIGVAFAFLANVGESVAMNVFQGLIIGLSAVGLFSGVKNSVERKK